MTDINTSESQESVIENIVELEKLSSNEYFREDGSEPRPVLNEINLLVQKGQIWGVTGKSPFEIKLLLEIIGNIKPYREGRCALMEKGMKRSKRLILPHVFYIGNSEMVYKNMNVLEFLMFATAKSRTDKVEQQEQIFESLINIGLGSISLTPIRVLSKEQKAVILLLIGAYSKSSLIVFNFPDYHFDDVLAGAMAKISAFAVKKGKTLIFGTQNCDLIEKACSHMAFLHNGSIVFQGTVKDFRLTYDKVVITIWDKDAETISELLKGSLPQYRYDVSGGCLTVSNPDDTPGSNRLLYEKVIETGFTPEKIIFNSKKVQNACGEIVKKYDLQEELL